MGLYTELPGDIGEVDVIIAGGGTAGCIIAGRLAEADPQLSILLVEGGTNNDKPTIAIPALWIANLVPQTGTCNFHVANQSKAVGDREVVVPSGGVLGGGSSVNAMMYSRAQRDDFDSWKTPGWSANEVLPYLQKLETYHGPGSKDCHGSDGPIGVSDSTYRVTKSGDEFIRAAGELGYPLIEDLQNLDANNGIERSLRYISPDGKRQDTASRYIHPKLTDDKYANLHILVESQVVRILFEDKKAVGLEFRPSPKSQPGVANSIPVRSVKARKTVVVSCGAFGSPLLLERSGIGRQEILERAQVPLLIDLPGVGHDYMDHQFTAASYKSSLDINDTIDAIRDGRRNFPELIQSNDTILGWNTIDITSKLRPNDADVVALGPHFQKIWDRDFKNSPNRPVAIMTMISAFAGDPTIRPAGQYFGIAPFLAYPYARGHVHITGPDPSDKMDFDTGYLADVDGIDIKKLLWAYKKGREIARRMKIYRGESPISHPAFPDDSKAACISTDTPLTNVKDIEYSAQDDTIIETWIREKVATSWHSAGTCKMAPIEELGVVDAQLNVYGVQGLKVADLSIMPQNVAANTNNTALMIGEKAADIIIKELGLGK